MRLFIFWNWSKWNFWEFSWMFSVWWVYIVISWINWILIDCFLMNILKWFNFFLFYLIIFLFKLVIYWHSSFGSFLCKCYLANIILSFDDEFFLSFYLFSYLVLMHSFNDHWSSFINITCEVINKRIIILLYSPLRMHRSYRCCFCSDIF